MVLIVIKVLHFFLSLAFAALSPESAELPTLSNSATSNLDAQQKLRDYLFPNLRNSNNQHRELYGKYYPDSRHTCPNVPQKSNNFTVPPNIIQCTKCLHMYYCPILQNYEIQEVYYPNNPELLGTCQVIDELAFRISQTAFGVGTTFRDTPECRDMVLQYLCLFWGSDNFMYSNCCQWQEDVTEANPLDHKVAPRFPCRSFCVQVASVCANDETFVQLCHNIPCPPTEEDCTPDPTVNGQVLAANLGCELPYDIDPYARKNAAHAVCYSSLTWLAPALLWTWMWHANR